jgi:dTDP-glucose 4,6-dehydratase
MVNFDAETHVDRSIHNARPFVETNIAGTVEHLEATHTCLGTLKRPERSRFRFVHVSTDEAYGALGPSGAFVETTPYAPHSPYAASTAVADHFGRAYHGTYGLPTLVTNCSNSYGPYRFPEKPIPLMRLNAIEGQPLPMYGDGGHVRDGCTSRIIVPASSWSCGTARSEKGTTSEAAAGARAYRSWSKHVRDFLGQRLFWGEPVSHGPLE